MFLQQICHKCCSIWYLTSCLAWRVRWTIQFSSCFIPYFPDLFSVRSFSFHDCYCLLFPCSLLMFFFMCPQRKQLLSSLFILSKYLTGMARYDPHAQALEDNSFDWHCIVCHDIPMSPLHIEMQHLGGDLSVYTDLDGTLWVKCDKCHTPFHLKCATEESENCVRSKRFICTFFCCRQF